MNQNPLLSALGMHGGDTMTMVPMPLSPAIDAGQNQFSPGPWDQRLLGYPRIINYIIDIGAVETQNPPVVPDQPYSPTNPLTPAWLIVGNFISGLPAMSVIAKALADLNANPPHSLDGQTDLLITAYANLVSGDNTDWLQWTDIQMESWLEQTAVALAQGTTPPDQRAPINPPDFGTALRDLTAGPSSDSLGAQAELLLAAYATLSSDANAGWLTWTQDQLESYLQQEAALLGGG